MRACIGREFKPQSFHNLQLNTNLLLIGYTPCGQYFVTLTSDCKFVHYYPVLFCSFLSSRSSSPSSSDSSTSLSYSASISTSQKSATLTYP
ncbi:hypothetical protein TrRE_jg1787 [Triparma retinervis]|uniref:Uncharacterized protein n=1 Tax=Triparma retinervis TaxID=2557542 RepID=A0A9W7G849_9STRA|nr:hypothetical protein TrRE_jg1787 [Triparma retinervis]